MSIAGMQLFCVREVLNFFFFLYDYISVFSAIFTLVSEIQFLFTGWCSNFM